MRGQDPGTGSAHWSSGLAAADPIRRQVFNTTTAGPFSPELLHATARRARESRPSRVVVDDGRRHLRQNSLFDQAILSRGAHGLHGEVGHSACRQSSLTNSSMAPPVGDSSVQLAPKMSRRPVLPTSVSTMLCEPFLEATSFTQASPRPWLRSSACSS